MSAKGRNNWAIVSLLDVGYSGFAGVDCCDREILRRVTPSQSALDFNFIKQVQELSKADVDIDPTLFYPPLRDRKGGSRDLPLVDRDLRDALEAYLELRLAQDICAKAHRSAISISKKRSLFAELTPESHGVNVKKMGRCRIRLFALGSPYRFDRCY